MRLANSRKQHRKSFNWGKTTNKWWIISYSFVTKQTELRSVDPITSGRVNLPITRGQCGQWFRLKATGDRVKYAARNWLVKQNWPVLCTALHVHENQFKICQKLVHFWSDNYSAPHTRGPSTYADTGFLHDGTRARVRYWYAVMLWIYIQNN